MFGSLYRNSNDTSNAVVTVTTQACGTWEGRSNHWYVEGGVLTTVQNDRVTLLNAGSCAIECPPGWLPDGNGRCYEPSPIIIATGKGARYRLTSPANGVLFDFDGDGVPEQMAWTESDSDGAFLALDRDGDGKITSARELFGNITLAGVANGFDALLRMTMETNGGILRGSVSSDDPIFAQLLLWKDTNHNGFSEPWELRPASELLAEIGLGYNITNRQDQFGNVFRFRGWARIRTAPGRNAARTPREERDRTLPIWDAYLRVAR